MSMDYQKDYRPGDYIRVMNIANHPQAGQLGIVQERINGHEYRVLFASGQAVVSNTAFNATGSAPRYPSQQPDYDALAACASLPEVA